MELTAQHRNASRCAVRELWVERRSFQLPQSPQIRTYLFTYKDEKVSKVVCFRNQAMPLKVPARGWIEIDRTRIDQRV